MKEDMKAKFRITGTVYSIKIKPIRELKQMSSWRNIGGVKSTVRKTYNTTSTTLSPCVVGRRSPKDFDYHFQNPDGICYGIFDEWIDSKQEIIPESLREDD